MSQSIKKDTSSKTEISQRGASDLVLVLVIMFVVGILVTGLLNSGVRSYLSGVKKRQNRESDESVVAAAGYIHSLIGKGVIGFSSTSAAIDTVLSPQLGDQWSVIATSPPTLELTLCDPAKSSSTAWDNAANLQSTSNPISTCGTMGQQKIKITFVQGQGTCPARWMEFDFLNTTRANSVAKRVRLNVPCPQSDVSVGKNTACGIFADGKIACWGQGEMQLGIGRSFCIKSPFPRFVDTSQVTGTPEFSSLVSGDRFNCALNKEGTPHCWGFNDQYQLGRTWDSQHRSYRPNPIDLSTIAPSASKKFVSLSAGGAYACGITDERAIYCWGNDEGAQLGILPPAGAAISLPVKVDESTLNPGEKWDKVSAGLFQTCAITTAQRLFCWGQGASGWSPQGALGNVNAPQSMNTRIPTPTLVDVSFLGADSKFSFVSADYANICGITTGGRLACWGDNSRNILNQNSMSPNYYYVPRALPATPDGSSFTQISTGMEYACGVTTSHKAYCWGAINFGHISTPGSPYREVDSSMLKGGAYWKKIQVSRLEFGFHTLSTCASASDGNIYCWGGDLNGELGNGAPYENAALPSLIANPE